MGIAVFANDEQWDEIKKNALATLCDRLGSTKDINSTIDFFLILDETFLFDYTTTDKPVFINQVVIPLHEMNLPTNVIRFNGWNGFIASSVWEVAGTITQPIHQKISSALKKRLIAVPDEPGFISARIIAMVINEAYFALSENVGTKQAINTAMRLGTNYPYGPFEWAEMIGINKIYALLQKLSATDKRYAPAAVLCQEALLWA